MSRRVPLPSLLRAYHPRPPTVTKKPFADLPSSPLSSPPDTSKTPRHGHIAVQASPRTRRGRKPKSNITHVPLEQPRNSLATSILANRSRFPHCILLTRVGQFYESYFDQASQVARLLSIKLTSRVWDKQNVPMCGFPTMHLDKYLKALVQQHKLSVAMCEEFPRYTNGQKPEFDRRVVRIISPGTLIDESFLNPFENNYLLTIHTHSVGPSTRELALAWIDVSTGDFFTKTTPFEGLKDDLARISPREIVLKQELRDQLYDQLRKLLEDEGSVLTYVGPSLDSDDISAQYDSTYSPEESTAINILTTYMSTNLMEYMPQLPTPLREHVDERMQIDSHTIKALEVHENAAEGGRSGSLLSAINRTTTSSGTRSLRNKLCSPSTSLKEIEARQSLVAFFYHRPHLLDDIVRLLQDSEDAHRIIQRFVSCRGEPKDLLAINRTIHSWTNIQSRIEHEKVMERLEQNDVHRDDWSSVDALVSKITSLNDLSARIFLALENVEFPALSPDEPVEEESAEGEQKSSGTLYGTYKRTIRPEFSGELAALHNTLRVLLERKGTLERDLQMRYNAPSLTLRTSPSQGMHVHVGKAKRDQSKIKIDPSFIGISESTSTSSYFYQPWSQLGCQIVETTTAIANAEKQIFSLLRDEVKAFSPQLRHNARIIDELDVALGFASLAAELKFVRPVIKDDATYEVVDGRHPTVELGLLTSGRVFTPNSVALGPHSRLHIITGPNMAGKSTFLRQTALIAILAQTGSFVPAERAVVGIVDKLFSRVGARDDVFRDQSTFMVEMLETAKILRGATNKSLVIMDEVGRGTTVRDGLAIAFAAVHHLVAHNRCRALFATHFHELADLLAYSDLNHHGGGMFRGVGFFCTDVHEAEGDLFTYSHRLEPGVNRNSHALKVAQLAGVPDSAILLAKNVLAALGRQQLLNTKELSSIGKELTTGEINAL